MHLNAYKILVIGHLALLLLMYISYFIEPYYFDGSGGMSNYGVDSRTVALFTLGFVVVAYSLYKASKQPEIRHNVSLQKLLRVLAVLYIVALGSTYLYQVNEFFDVIHKLAGSALAIYFVISSVWLLKQVWPGWVALILLFFVIAGFITVAVSLLTPAVYLSQGQALTTLAFSVLLISTVKKLSHHRA